MALITKVGNVQFPRIHHQIRGVFKGGGAKGIVYCGALYELRARGIWFDSVAGSSAGAITAALIAAGYSPNELIELVGDALKSVKLNLVTWLRPRNRERAYFKTTALRNWLEDALCSRVDPNGGGHPLFLAISVPRALSHLHYCKRLGTGDESYFRRYPNRRVSLHIGRNRRSEIKTLFALAQTSAALVTRKGQRAVNA